MQWDTIRRTLITIFTSNMPNVTFDNFNAGEAEDIYNASKNEFAAAVHLDSFSQPGRLRPFRSWEAITSGTNIRTFHYASDGELYALGDNGSSNARIFELDGTSWTQPSNNTASSGTVDEEMLFEHQGYLYMWNSSSQIGRWKMDGTAYTTNWFAIPASVTTSRGATNTFNSFQAGPGIRFPLTDQAYFAYENVLFGIDIASDTPAAQLILPQEYKITSLSYWNSYMAVGVQRKDGFNDSKVFFWDTISADPSFVKEIPEGELHILRNIGGELACISKFSSATFIRGATVIASTFNGGEFIQRRRLVLDYDSSAITIKDIGGAVKNNQLYFNIRYGTTNRIVRFGFNKGRYNLVEEKYITNDDTAASLLGLGVVGDTFYVAYTETGSGTYKTIGTNTSKDYTMTDKPVYETIKIPAGAKGVKGKLNSIGVFTAHIADESAPTPATATIEIKYKVDQETSWTTLGTHTATSQDYTLLTQEGTDNEFPEDWQYIQIQGEFTSLAQLAALNIDWEEIPSEVG